jgi:dihydroxyacetone kinase
VKAHRDLVRLFATNRRVVVSTTAPVAGKVGVATGGGSGHEPAFIGYTGPNLLDAVAIDELFSSPTAKSFHDASRSIRRRSATRRSSIRSRPRRRSSTRRCPTAARSRKLDALTAVVETARDSTIDLEARIGRASRLGERSRGLLDAGATSCAMILGVLADGAKARLPPDPQLRSLSR